MFAIALSAGLYATHVFVPPTPGPLAAAAILEANLGMLIILGLVVAVFSSAAGYFWSKFIGKKIIITSSSVSENKDASSYSPNRTFSFAPILMPVILIALKSISDYPTHPFGEGIIHSTHSFVGEPIIAILIGTFLALTLKKDNKASHFNWMETGIREAGIIILITGAGGAFGNVLREGGIGDVIGENLSQLNLGIFLPFILAAVIKSAQGSSTVAIVTTAAIISPLLDILGLTTEMGRVLAVLSIGAGAMTVSHLNDSYFWVVSQFSEMNTSQALRSQTISTLLQGIAGIMVISILSAVLT
jgi:GntP family gluconate:H+ symporter